MNILILQITGGLLYFFNKFFFAAAERSKESSAIRKWSLAAWIVYLAGVFPWVTIFLIEKNWIAAAVESSGVSAMIMGLVNAGGKNSNRGLSRFLELLSRTMIIAGLGFSLYDFGGITAVNQVIELGIAAGFLFGTFFRAKSSPAGYLWLLFGNASAALLMWRQSYLILMVQQLLSIILVADALRSSRIKKEALNTQ